MIYTADLNRGQSIEIESQGAQTRVSLHSHGAGGQQSQSSSFATGEWSAAPTLTPEAGGYTLRIHSSQGTRAFRISSHGIQALEEAPQAQGEPITLRPSGSAGAMPPLAPMKPMQPMKMGDMEMKPGEMRMGSMRMSMNHAPAEPAGVSEPQVLEAGGEPAKGRFCTQCGERAQAEDRFCHSCGHRLRAA